MTTNYHTPIANGATNGATTWNTPFSTLDAAISALSGAGGTFTLANGAASAGQKVVTVDSTSGLVAGASVVYALAGGSVETNAIGTVDSGTQITLTTNIGTGGIPDNGVIAQQTPDVAAAATITPYGNSHVPTLASALRDANHGIYNVRRYGAVGDGSTDDSAAVQAAITAASGAGGGVVVFPDRNTYCINATVNLASNVNLAGDGATLKAGASMYTQVAILDGAGVSNVSIFGLKFDGAGSWTSTPFANPSGGGNSVGWTTNNEAIRIDGSGSNIQISHCTFTGTGYAGILIVARKVRIDNCYFSSLARTAIFVSDCDVINISNCQMSDIEGNQTAAATTVTTASKYGDGVYIYRSRNVTVTGCYFSGILRIGVVMESNSVSAVRLWHGLLSTSGFDGADTVTGGTSGATGEVWEIGSGFLILKNVTGTFVVGETITGSVTGATAAVTETNATWTESDKNNERVTITGNTFTNIRGSADRGGGEYSSGVWGEGGKSESSILISGNVIDNIESYGILINRGTATGNYIRFCGTGITGWEFRAQGNTVEYCQHGISVGESQVAGESTSIIGNVVRLSHSAGLLVYRAHGVITIVGNEIADNGREDTFAGVHIVRYYNDQRVVIQGNTFLTTANETSTYGQFYAILGVSGGDFNYTIRHITGNYFIFAGTYSSTYPTILSIVPTSFAYDNTSTITKLELNQWHGNYNSKYPEATTLTTQSNVVESAYIAISSGNGQSINTGLLVNSRNSRLVLLTFDSDASARTDTYLRLFNTDGAAGSVVDAAVSSNTNSAGMTFTSLTSSAINGEQRLVVNGDFANAGRLTVTLLG